MSTLKVTNIQATGETASRAVSGVAAAWVNFNGTGSVAVRDSQNVSGLVDNGTGDYNVNLSNNMTNSNYCLVLGHRGNRPADGDGGLAGYSASTYEVGSRSGDIGSSKEDSDRMHSAIHGDLA